jgi:hypothetical protein
MYDPFGAQSAPMVPALIRNFPVDLDIRPCKNLDLRRAGGRSVRHSRQSKRRCAMKNQLRSRLREFARSLREKSPLTRLKTKKPTLNPAPMNPAPFSRIKGWLNAHDLMPRKGRR